MVNNILYVIILTAALDLVGPSIPKGTVRGLVARFQKTHADYIWTPQVLLASIIPSLATKLVVPYIIHLVPYSPRIVIFAALSTCGMLAVALSPTTANARSIAAKIAGIVLANISSGAGEVNFLSLTHFYGPFALASWGSGTGGAGLIGAGAYALATTQLGISVRTTLLTSALLPIVMLLSFFALLPRGPLQTARRKEVKGQGLAHAVGRTEDEPGETAGLLDQHGDESIASIHTKQSRHWLQRAVSDLRAKLTRAKSLVLPYMVPLFLVYLAEYTINQGVAPTLLFPLDQSPFKHYRAFYPTYGALYQLGVFISRSSLAFFRIRALYIPSFLQILNLLVLTVHALVPFLPTVYFVFAIVLWEGLLGGLVYVSTYAAVQDEIPEEDREFSLGAVAVSDAVGICLAGFLGVGMESGICSWQVKHGRDWCRQL